MHNIEPGYLMIFALLVLGATVLGALFPTPNRIRRVVLLAGFLAWTGFCVVHLLSQLAKQQFGYSETRHIFMIFTLPIYFVSGCLILGIVFSVFFHLYKPSRISHVD